MEEETLVAFAIILFLFLRRRRNQREKMLEEKSGFIRSFNKKLGEHAASTTTSSESLVWMIENVISGKRD